MADSADGAGQAHFAEINGVLWRGTPGERREERRCRGEIGCGITEFQAAGDVEIDVMRAEPGAAAGFEYGDLSWQADPTKPVGINPVGAKRDGHSIDGVLPDDQRRSGGFVWPPTKENYVWEALQGAIAQAVISIGQNSGPAAIDSVESASDDPMASPTASA